MVGNEEEKQAQAKSQQPKSNREERRSEIKGHAGCYQTQDQKRITKKIAVLSCLLV